MSSSSANMYTGYNELIEYLKNYQNKSFRGFLFQYREIIVTSTMETVMNWFDLNNNWYDHFVTEAKELLLNQETFVTLKEKVRLLFYIDRVTLSRARFDLRELLRIDAGNHSSFLYSGALTLSLIKVY